MKRILFLSLMICSVMLGLSACGSNKTDSDEVVNEKVTEDADIHDNLEIKSIKDSEDNELSDYEVLYSMSDEEIESNITGVYKILKNSEGDYMFAVYADTYEDFKVVDIDTYCEALGVSKDLVINTIEDGSFYDVLGYAYPDSYNNGSDDDITHIEEEFTSSEKLQNESNE